MGTGCTIVTTPTHYGAGTMKLTAGVGTRSSEQSIPVIASARTKVSCWIQTAGSSTARPDSSYSFTMRVALQSALRLPGQPRPTTSWTYYSATPTAPSTAATANIKILMDSNGIGNTGNAYFDDIRFMTTGNKLVNGFFEKGLANWIQPGPASVATITTTASEVRSGTQAVKMGGATNYFGNYQDFTATPSTIYTVSGYIKTNAIQVGKVAAIWLEWYNSSNVRIGSTLAVGTSLTGTNPYTLRTATFTSPANTAYGRVIMRYDGTTSSTAWYDDIYVK